MKSLLIFCGHCGKKAKNHKDNEKVIKDYVDILCYSCKMEFEDSMEDIARRYLHNKQ